MDEKLQSNVNANTNTMNTKLGPKGYTLLKKELSLEKQQWIRKQLTVKPFTAGAPVQTANTFEVWRENDAKIYVPRYFGEKHFGIAKQTVIPVGDAIHLEFHGALRDYQKPVVEEYMEYIRDPSKSGRFGSGSSEIVVGRGGLLDLYPAWGKTSSALNLVSRLGVKTLVVVGKEFLMNQWIERIGQFLPQARIGKIQGPTIDIEDKDIVLVMIQSLVSKNKSYPPELFASFGFTIFDEVHHVSSEVFSKSLFSLVTRYMLGLSGTMDRKDGTTDVFKMFLGEVVHRAKRKENDLAVEVRKMTYLSHDAEFEDVILDFRGKPQISSMISKICDYHSRTNFILKVLRDFIQVENTDANADANANANADANASMKHEVCETCGNPDIYPMQTTCCAEKSKKKGSKNEGLDANAGGEKKYRCLTCWEAYEYAWENNYRREWTTDIRTKRRKETRVYPQGRQTKCPYCQRKLKYEPNYVEQATVKPYTQLQTIILSHNLNILKYMYRHIVATNMASVGYYVGGMKLEELKKSETKHVILATYAMAAEGLDIPSLNAEFLITPKTDIEQTVGRILRAKHPITSPVIVDFVDTHDTFKRQWFKRRKYYKQEGYKIVETTSDIYNANANTNSNNYTNMKKNGTEVFKSNDNEEEENDEEYEENEEDEKNGGGGGGGGNGFLKGVLFIK